MHDLGIECGVPVRWCNSHGIPTHIRMGIRSYKAQDTLIEYWKAKLL